MSDFSNGVPTYGSPTNALTLEPLVATAEPSIEVPEPGNLSEYLMPNPAMPRLYVKIKRGGKSDTLIVEPESLEWVSSVDAADMLKFTVPDPEYLLIDHPMLIEDFKTEVSFRYGYDTVMSDMAVMRFFRQRPEFPESGPVKTTIVCYDLSVFLNFELPAKTVGKSKPISVREAVQDAVADANKVFGLGLEVVFDNCEWENTYYRVTRPAGPIISHLARIRNTAKARGGADETRAEIFVNGRKLHFHPPRRQFKPIGAFAYYAEHPGSRLLSFEPQVDLQFSGQKNRKVKGVDADSGSVIDADTGKRTGQRTTNSRVIINGASGAVSPARQTSRTGDSPSQAEHKRETVDYKVRGDEGSLSGILEKFPGVSPQEFLDVNGLDLDEFELEPNRVLKVPVPDAEGTVSTPEDEGMSMAEKLAYESRALNASASVLGNPRLLGGFPADFFNVGAKWSGRWYIREATHIFGSDGYKVNMSLTREGFTVTDGFDLETEAGGTENTDPTAPQDAAEQNKNNVAINGADGGVDDRRNR